MTREKEYREEASAIIREIFATDVIIPLSILRSYATHGTTPLHVNEVRLGQFQRVSDTIDIFSQDSVAPVEVLRDLAVEPDSFERIVTYVANYVEEQATLRKNKRTLPPTRFREVRDDLNELIEAAYPELLQHPTVKISTISNRLCARIESNRRGMDYQLG